MFEKQNLVPKKQGALYELNLGKDNGPYLNKDIMPNNPKSIALLAGTQIMRNFASLNQSMNLSESKQKEYFQTLMIVQSFQSSFETIEQEILINIEKNQKFKKEQIKLRNQFAQFNEVVNDNNQKLFDQYIPLFRSLHRIVKEQASLQRQETFRMGRQLRQIQQSKKNILEGIFLCEQNIMNTQKSFDPLSAEQARQMRKKE